MSIPTIKLKKGKEISVLRKHPWVFSGAISFLPKSTSDGEIVNVVAFDDKFLGKGHYQGGGSISVRIISFDDQNIDQDFWNKIIYNAKTYRDSLQLIGNPLTNTYRLIHGEGDGIPGLIIDIYNDIAVIQCHSIGVHKDSSAIGQAICNNYGSIIHAIYIRSKDTLPENYGPTVEDGYHMGDKEETIIIENGANFKINVITGQKTGFFLDQRENRLLLQAFSASKSVLNCFCYTGGFSIYALMAGAQVVDSVDISQKAMDLLEENLSLNKFEGTHHSFCANVMHFLGDESLPLYDVVIVDPPAFAKSIHKRHNAVQAYKRLNALAFKKVKSGGYLFTFSCSQVVGTQLFYDTIVAAGMDAGKSVRVVKSLSQGPDHPVNLFHPEGHYL
ncbi:MAG TPA: class I SAM-dependent rRNA methyltransferase, partial [Saprospiraceae bacterium]|nr:class I SAM-dependent rRNA methyltransferase [Saprospiraceae bacterium]